MKYTTEQFLKAAEEAEVSMIDARHVVEVMEREAQGEVTDEWISVEDEMPESGFEVLLFNKRWINEDYNPKGVRIGYLDDLTGWTSAHWCSTHDDYHTRISEEDNDQFRDFEGKNQIPTHWMEIKAMKYIHPDNESRGNAHAKAIWKFKIYINRKLYEVNEQFITGLQIKAYVNSPKNYGVWLKVSGLGHDKEISDNEQVDLNQPYRDQYFTGSKAITEG